MNRRGGNVYRRRGTSEQSLPSDLCSRLACVSSLGRVVTSLILGPNTSMMQNPCKSPVM
ncbi:hypothetical protein KFK09_009581 [Dendrobium nobile]|uniref:Uncharacterized protein n=1 Tax=Dendrobium nobile TaxID=94219 RepID=A0A8T3BN58_DENNO|nr:hypothetical protein KFK09_009581 [Dendrobium nobile]